MPLWQADRYRANDGMAVARQPQRQAHRQCRSTTSFARSLECSALRFPSNFQTKGYARPMILVSFLGGYVAHPLDQEPRNRGEAEDPWSLAFCPHSCRVHDPRRFNPGQPTRTPEGSELPQTGAMPKWNCVPSVIAGTFSVPNAVERNNLTSRVWDGTSRQRHAPIPASADA
jgi:hypothetical protein